MERISVNSAAQFAECFGLGARLNDSELRLLSVWSNLIFK